MQRVVEDCGRAMFSWRRTSTQWAELTPGNEGYRDRAEHFIAPPLPSRTASKSADLGNVNMTSPMVRGIELPGLFATWCAHPWSVFISDQTVLVGRHTAFASNP